MIEIRNISKKYGSNIIISDINLKIPKNSITTFIGTNGAGKSTLLSVISRLISKDSGEIIIDNKNISAYSTNELSKKISILRQSNHLSLRLTVRELVSFGRFPHSKGKLTKIDIGFIEKAIKYMNLSEIENKYLDELSGGQKQRAFIAMVIAQDTEYILLDEPLNNIDMKNSVEIMKTLKELVEKSGKTVIVVLHDINFTSCYSDYIVALKKGKVIHTGSVDEIINKAVLKSIFDMNFDIYKLKNHSICSYFI